MRVYENVSPYEPYETEVILLETYTKLLVAELLQHPNGSSLIHFIWKPPISETPVMNTADATTVPYQQEPVFSNPEAHLH